MLSVGRSRDPILIRVWDYFTTLTIGIIEGRGGQRRRIERMIIVDMDTNYSIYLPYQAI